MALTKFMLLLLLVLSLCFPFKFCTSTDTITQNQFIRDPETIISAQNTFRFGFFSPINTTYRYVGIFYTISVSTAIWVANRNNPLEDNSGIVNISEDGNLVVINGQNEVIWSSNVSNSMLNSTAQLLDTGNLVLRDNISGRTIWESFQNPTDSFLQGMRLSTDTNTGRRNILTSWQSPSNPSIGSFSVGVVVHLSIAEIFVWNRSSPYWRSGPRSEQTFIEIPGKDSVALNGFNVVDDREGTVYLTYTYTNESILTYLFLNSEGNLTQRFWRESRQDWEVSHSSMNNECKVYGKCGPFGSCDSSKRPICSCLRGFEAKNTEEWRRGNWSSGCIRRTPLQCERNSSTSEADGFLKMTITKVPVFPEWSPASEDNCGSHCLRNCSCMAYAYHSGIGCMQWSGNLIDIQKVYNGVTDFYVRLAYSELEKKKNMTLIISLPVIVGSLVVLVCAYFSWKWMAKRRGYSAENKIPANANRMKIKELPLFSLKQVVNATNNFHAANKLGEGGFGPVYKGNLPDGQEIAVKRLSRSSHQGSEEFMNEVLLISKLQHRNLVRLLGCCVEEKMLIYEYMPNKSLDGFLFESTKQEVLDWKKRVNIVEGIGRGLLYLHRDSRLRIIHRDLKTNNILLDEELNPKISDFGMARIFGGKQDQAKTRRVVGTYGYMAPEYAMHGRFSEKIDVYSFGVLILEIVSGKKNTSFYHHELSLVNYAWKLWNQGESIAFVDPNINDASCEMEMLRHIHVGLLCVQESPKDRPTVSAVLSMLSSETSDLPTPRHPAFSGEEASSDKTSHICSSNNVSITIIEAR